MTDDFLRRFGGISRLYGLASLERFSRSHVMVVGLGGVGSWTVEALARSGIGKLTLVDLDDLCLTNTNRQIHALNETIGRSKAGVLAERVGSINPEALCEVKASFYTEKNSADLLTEEIDIVVDAIDSVRPKCHLLATCHSRGLPVIACGGAGGRIDPSLIQVDDLSRTHGDPLLLSVRKQLRADYRFPKARDSKKKTPKFRIPAVFSPEIPRFPTCDGEVTTERPADLPGTIKCDSGFGACTHVTATFGNHLAAWVLRELCDSREKSPQGIKKPATEK